MKGKKVVEGAEEEMAAAAQRSQLARDNLATLKEQMAAKHRAR